MILRNVIAFIFLMGTLFVNAQTDFPALQNQFLDYRKAYKQDSALFIARQMNALALREQTDSSYWHALSFRYVGNIYYSNGNYDSTTFYWVKSVLLFNKYHLNHPDYGVSLNSLGVLYTALCNYKASEFYLSQSLMHRKRTLGEKHPEYAGVLNNLGNLYEDIGNYKAAEDYYKQALVIIKKNLGEKHPENAGVLNNLGILYWEIGDYKAAEDYYKQALEIKKKALGAEHPDYANSLNNLGILYRTMGDYKAAEDYYKQALVIIKKNLGEKHQIFLSIQKSYANLLLKTNRELEAYDILNNNFSKKSKEIADNFEWLNDNQKEAYWKKESEFYNDLSWFANESVKKVPEVAGLNYNSALVTKSKMLELKISSENYYREVDELREQLANRRRLLAKMESDGSTEKEKLEKLNQEADSLDKRLTQSWPEYAQQKKNLSITWDQVQQNLDISEAAIEFVRFKNEDDSLYYYNALVVRKGDLFPRLIKLCKEQDVKAISPKMGFSAYYPLIWQPIEAALKDIVTIYYAPVGELYNIPFSAIYSSKGKGDEVLAAKIDKRGVVVETENANTEQNAEYLMDRYTMHQLTSTRYLAMGLKQKVKEPIGNTMAMVGGVNYDYLPGTTSTPKKNKKDKNANRSSESASGKLAYLEGTKTEVEQINQQVTTAAWQTKLIENNNATEETITKLEGKETKGILHIATHGFAFSEYDFKDTTVNKNSLRYSYRYSTNPMVRSGLILAGGNWAWTGSDTLTKLGAEQNGILTALEVSQLNLKNTKLVVLSACETGLGKIEGSEGTFGLKRGFKLAGVEQIIVSLWSVPDKETMELMTLFYSDLTKTLNPVISFEKAQKEMRNKYPTEPEKWAGFVLVR
jgi:CHAT domain-containing protein